MAEASWWIEIVKVVGPCVALCIFIVIQETRRERRTAKDVKEREERMGRRLDQQADMIQNTLIKQLQETTTICGQAQVTMARSNAILEDYVRLQKEDMELRREELEFKRKTAVLKHV